MTPASMARFPDWPRVAAGGQAVRAAAGSGGARASSCRQLTAILSPYTICTAASLVRAPVPRPGSNRLTRKETLPILGVLW